MDKLVDICYVILGYTLLINMQFICDKLEAKRGVPVKYWKFVLALVAVFLILVALPDIVTIIFTTASLFVIVGYKIGHPKDKD